MSKFKVGDRVITTSDLANNSEDIFKTGTIDKVIFNRNNYSYRIKFDLGGHNPWDDDELEFEAVYNSPLYKALS